MVQGGGAVPSPVFEAAEARMQKLRKVAEQQEAAQHGHEAPGPIGRVLGVLGDATMLTLAGIVGFSGYYSLAYRDTRELEAMVNETCAANSAALSSPSGGSGKPSFPSPPPPSSSSSSSSSSSGGSTAADASTVDGSNLLEQARAQATGLWCSAIRKYLRMRKAVEEQVESYTAPTYHKLLPDMAPELRGR